MHSVRAADLKRGAHHGIHSIGVRTTNLKRRLAARRCKTSGGIDVAPVRDWVLGGRYPENLRHLRVILLPQTNPVSECEPAAMSQPGLFSVHAPPGRNDLWLQHRASYDGARFFDGLVGTSPP